MDSVCCMPTGLPWGSLRSVFSPRPSMNQKGILCTAFGIRNLQFTFVYENGLCAHGVLVLRKRPEEGYRKSCDHSLPYSLETGSLNDHGVSWQPSNSGDPPGFISHSTVLITEAWLARPGLSHGCWGSELRLWGVFSRHPYLLSCLTSPTGSVWLHNCVSFQEQCACTEEMLGNEQCGVTLWLALLPTLGKKNH